MSTFMGRMNFPDSQLTTRLPALNALTFTQFNTYPEEYSQVFNVKNSVRDIEQFSGMSGFGLFRKIGEKEPITFDDVRQTFDKTFIHQDWALGYMVTHQLDRDDKFNIIASFARELGRSAAITIEIENASDFNNGFSGSFLGPDGVALFSTSHPRVKGGGVQANKPSVDVDLDIPNLQQALIDIAGWTDDSGKLWMVQPRKLIIPPALEFVATEILASPMRSDTANNAVSALRNRPGGLNTLSMVPFVWHYLTDPDAWFISAAPSDLKLCVFWRERFHTISDMHFYTRAMLTGGWMAFSHGWYDWVGVWGTSGG